MPDFTVHDVDDVLFRKAQPLFVGLRDVVQADCAPQKGFSAVERQARAAQMTFAQ